MIYPSITKLFKLFTIILLFLLIFYIITKSLSIVIPIILVVLITTMIEPLVFILEKHIKFPRPLATASVLIFFLAIIIGFFYLIFTEIYDGISYLSEIIPKQMNNFNKIYHYYYEQIGKPFYDSITSLLNFEMKMDQFIQSIISFIGGVFENILSSISQVLTHIPNSFTIIIFIVFAIFLLSADFPNIKERITNYIPDSVSHKYREMKIYLKRQALGYIRGQLILIGITLLLLFIGLSILNIHHALTIALIVFIIDLIPFVGTGIIFIPWILYCFFTGDYELTIGLACLYSVIIITRQLLEPRVLAAQMNIHPILWLLAAFLGFKLGGIFGMIVAPFILVFVKGLYDIGIFTALYLYIKNDGKQ